jgi:hypothetical protein
MSSRYSMSPQWKVSLYIIYWWAPLHTQYHYPLTLLMSIVERFRLNVVAAGKNEFSFQLPDGSGTQSSPLIKDG